MSTSHSVTLTGNLDTSAEADPVDAAEETPHELLAVVEEARAGRGDQAELMGLFRAATVYVEAIPTEQGRALQWVRYEGLSWVPVFTSLGQLAAFFHEAGRGDEHVDYGQLTGADLIDKGLPALPRGTGIVLDPVSDHVLALPPVPGIVPDELAISPEQ